MRQLDAEAQLVWQVYRLIGDPRERIEFLLNQKRTGQLTLNIHQGQVKSLEWKERPPTYDSGGALPEPLPHPMEHQ